MIGFVSLIRFTKFQPCSLTYCILNNNFVIMHIHTNRFTLFYFLTFIIFNTNILNKFNFTNLYFLFTIGNCTFATFFKEFPTRLKKKNKTSKYSCYVWQLNF